MLFAWPVFAASPQQYAGQYVLRLGERNFLVLNLTLDEGKLDGTLTRPQHSTLGAAFSEISVAAITEPISNVKILSDHLHFTASKPGDPANHEDYDLKVLSPTQATLQITDVPLDAWPLARVPVSPAQLVATDWEPGKTYSIEDMGKSSAEMQRILDADQKDRQSAGIAHLNWNSISDHDELHRTETLALLQTGALHSGKDFEDASVIFQHGNTPDDYLLAHTLAMIALARGDQGAMWMASATLDRYLHSIHVPQVFGTQFNRTRTSAWTQEPYNRSLVSDALRQKLNVPSQTAQKKQLEQYKLADPK